jgi:hypothetical protein
MTSFDKVATILQMPPEPGHTPQRLQYVETMEQICLVLNNHN